MRKPAVMRIVPTIALIASLIAMQGSVASLFDSVVNGIAGATGG